jgi:hypothetical protein
MIDIEGKLCAEDDFDEDFDEYEAANMGARSEAETRTRKPFIC